MSRFNTGNPLGSGDPRDLDDNAKNMDLAVNSDELSWSDRFGRDRKSFEGMEREFDADQASRDNAFESAQTYRENEFDSAQYSREARFNDFIAASGYQFLGDYGPGVELTEYNQLVRDGSGEFWRLSGTTALPYTTTGAGMPEGGAFVIVGDAVLRQELAAPGGAGLVGNGGIVFDSVSDMRAAAWLTVGQKVRTLGYYTPGDGGGNDYEVVAAGTGMDDGGSIVSLGGVLAQARGLFSVGAINAHQFGVSTSNPALVNDACMQAALNFKAIRNGGELICRSGIFSFDNFELPPNVTIVGEGVFDDSIYFGIPAEKTGTVFDFTGATGSTRSLPLESQFELIDPDTGVKYNTEDYTSFTCGIWSEGGNTDGIRGVTVCTKSAVGECLDVAVAFVDRQRARLSTVNSFGYWGKSGVLCTSVDSVHGDPSDSIQEFLIDHCKLQGKRGLSVRGPDDSPITAVTSSTVTLNAHSWITQLGNPVVIGFGGSTGATYSYTAFTDNGDGTVTLTGVSPDPLSNGVTTNSVAIFGQSLGSQGFTVRDSYLAGLEHASGDVATDLGFDSASGCTEVAGPPATGVRFINTLFFTQEDAIITLKGASGTRFISCNAEVKTDSSGLRGSRFIAPYSVTDYRSVVNDLSLLDCAFLRFVDMTPVYPRQSTTTKFSTDGFFDPLTHKNSEYEPQLERDNTRQKIQAAPGKIIEVCDENGNYLYRFDPAFLYLRNGRLRTEIGANFEQRTRGNLAQWRDTGNALRMEHDYINSVFKYDGIVRPLADNQYRNGDPNFRWTEFFAANGTISTSDIREKEQQRNTSDAEQRVALALKSCGQFFKWIASVDKKGDDARWHYGWMAQDVVAAFAEEGLDAHEYGMLCYDEWEELPEMKNEDGEIIQAYRPAGNRYGVRMSQLLAFIVCNT